MENTPAVHTNDSTEVESAKKFAPYVNPCAWGQVEDSVTPGATYTHYPLPHKDFVARIKESLSNSGYRIEKEAHQLSHEGARYIGVMKLTRDTTQQSLFGDNDEGGGLLLGARNSHDKAWSTGIISGSHLAVCSNGLFNGEVKIARKHTRHLMRDLPHLCDSAIRRFNIAAQKQSEQIAAYKECDLSTREANDLMIKALEAKAITASKLPKVIKAYKESPHPEFQPRNMWSLTNAFTEVYKEMSVDNVMSRSFNLHKVMDNHVALAS